MTDDTTISPFRIDIPDAALDDLRDRLARTRWPGELPGVGWSYGVPGARPRGLAAYWQAGYDWRAHEASLNKLPQFTTTIDGQRVHFVHVRSPEPGALPLILTHGWPGSVAEFSQLIGPLSDPRGHGGDPADAFHIVAPTLPGFGFSGPTTATGWDVSRIARAWAELMHRLGYPRYGAQGGDWGARISPELARLDGGHVAGLHVNAFVAFPSGDPAEMASLTAAEQDRLAWLGRWNAVRGGYAAIQASRPQTLAYALTDSPAGQLAWNLEWFDDYGEGERRISDDDILTNVALYWLTGTAGSAARLYFEAAASWGRQVEKSAVPTGIAVFPGDSTIRVFAEREHNVVRWSEFDRGGHFAALQAPGLLVQDIRAFFRGLRLRGGRLPGQPGGTALVQPLDLGPAAARHVRLDRVAHLLLQVGQVLVALGEPGQHGLVEGQRGGRVDRVDPVLLVDGLAQHHPPAPVPLLEEVVEPAQAAHVAQHAVHLGPLHDRHPGLGDGPGPAELDPAATGEVQDVDTPGCALLADPDEILLRPLPPGGHHVAVVVPAGPERRPVAGVPGAGPGLDDFADQQAVSKFGIHAGHGRPSRARGTTPVRPGRARWGMPGSDEFDVRPASWDDLSLVVAWRQFLRDPQFYFRHLF